MNMLPSKVRNAFLHMRHYSLVLTVDKAQQRVLLGYKKRGFGAHRWNGFGGKQNADETIRQCAERELIEESCLEATNMSQVGRILFEFVGDEPVFMDVNVFHVQEWSGEPQESEEMRPQWFSMNEIPYASMWPDDAEWLPLLLKGVRFRAYFQFEGHDHILYRWIHEVYSEADTMSPWQEEMFHTVGTYSSLESCPDLPDVKAEM